MYLFYLKSLKRNSDQQSRSQDINSVLVYDKKKPNIVKFEKLEVENI